MNISVPIGDAMRVPTSKCRSCRAPIFFAQTVKHRLIPIDIEPTQDGTFVVVDVAPPTVAAYAQNNSEHAGKARFQTHFMSCPNAVSHRKGRGA